MTRILAAVLLALFVNGCRTPPPPDMPVERLADPPRTFSGGIGSSSSNPYGPYKF